GLEAHVISQTDQEGKERLRGRFALCHPPLSKAPPLFFPQACPGGSRATRGKRSLARKSLAALKVYTEIVRVYMVVF
ncbi:hypothetical protein AAEO50_13395, partial [Rossellomorea oryzaecorticis]